MKGMLYPWWLILVVVALVGLQVSGQPWSLWADGICLPRRVRTSVNVRRHAERVARRQARRERRHRRDRRVLRRGLRRGRGTWDSDRLPVFGLLCRGGQVRLCVLKNVQTDTIRPIIGQLVARGAKVYTDSYAIYHFLERDGYRHQTVNHSAGEYALDLDGDGQCEVHGIIPIFWWDCNTMECTWSWLRPMVRTYTCGAVLP